MSRSASALVAFIALTAATCASVSCASATEPLAIVAMDPYVRQLRTVTVRVGDVEKPFLIDTGGGVTCITPELAQEAGCEPYGLSSGFRHNGERVDFLECGEMTLSVGGVALDVEVTVFDMNALLEELPPVGGLISVHTFAEQPFTIDLAANRLVLESPGSLEERTSSMAELSARYAHQAGGASLDPFVEVGAATGTLWLELDSGNISRTILAPHVTAQLALASTEDQTFALDLVGLGPTDLEIRFLDDCIYDGVLSAELFEAHVLTFDPPGERIWISK